MLFFFSWAWSLSLHAVLYIVLALLFLPLMPSKPLFEVFVEFDKLPDAIQQRLQQIGLNGDGDAIIITPQNMPPVENPIVKPPNVETVEDSSPINTSTDNDVPVGIGFGNRIGSHADSLGRGGGSGATDKAVLAGLRWLVRVQNSDGGWRLNTGRPAVPKERENRNAATAMALLAFQGFGVLPDSQDEFAKSIKMGWEFLRTKQHSDGCFFQDMGLIKTAHSDQRFYTHGLCTIALCERLAMSKDETLRESAAQAIDYCIKYQSISGGWRYRPDRFSPESDVSVTGWILFALKTGEAAGIPVSLDVYAKISTFLDQSSKHNETQYFYRSDEPEITVSMTAEALFCRELLGWKHNDPRLKTGLAILTLPENLPTFTEHYKRDVYSWYYATQALHHYGGEEWKAWNAAVRELLPDQQEKEGANAGSWNPEEPVQDKWGNHYGRLYTTCLSILILESYYRHTRIYQ